ncbi:LysR family transcriptional regulator YeiE [Vibrio astriarenae]|nr:LysR family transcriptional regulator YeiE [Vibrio sp. C7]
MDIKTLKTFVKVAKLKNFSAAARELHSVQPTVSRHISDLESELKTKLFERTTHQVELTASGERLLPEALKIIENDQRVKAMIAQTVVEGQHEIKIGYLATACAFFLPQLLKGFLEQYEGANARLYEMTPAEQALAMQENRVDIVFTRESIPLEANTYQSTLVYTDSLVAVLPQSHKLANHEQIDICDLSEERLHLFHRNEWLDVYERIVGCFNENGISPNVVGNPMNMRHLATSISAGLGISIAPKCIKSILDEQCVCVPVKEISIEVPVMAYYARHSSARLVKPFIEHCNAQREQLTRILD